MEGSQNEFQSFKDLCAEIDYQSVYTYEQRVDFFNKYKLSTAKKFINPVMLLTEHLLKAGGQYTEYSGFEFNGISHSGAVQSAFNKKLEEGVNDFVTIDQKGETTWVYRVFHHPYNNSLQKREKLERIMFIEKKTLVTFKISNFTFFPVPNYCFYRAAIEFCKDFGFNINFKNF